MDGISENIQFSWGKKRAKGGAKMDTQFYDSFTFDNVKYSLYDCVYLFKNGDPGPYVGKIVKIWQQNQAKKVKILWFFLPDEIRNYLRGPAMEKEIFLASGEGTGLADINPLDRSKWFKIPWDDRLRNADEQGTLVYIQNLDLQFGDADIEELIREALQLSCIAKPINHPTYDDPNNGKAYAIFKNKGAADTAISKINSGLVVGGRPLYCSKGLLKVPKPSGTLVGHLTIHNLKMTLKQREEQKKAVSTSHCSQPNTMEYDLALDWMLAREKQERRFRTLHKNHKEQRKTYVSKMGK